MKTRIIGQVFVAIPFTLFTLSLLTDPEFTAKISKVFAGLGIVAMFWILVGFLVDVFAQIVESESGNDL